MFVAAKQVFLQVCDLDPEARRERLEELCGVNQTLRKEVERLLRHDSPESVFDSPSPNDRPAGEDESPFGSATADIPDPWIGRTIQSYKLLASVGRGGMGEVYRAEDIRLKRPVAVKFLGPHLLRDEGQKRRFLREAQAAGSLDHPSICPVYDVGEVDGHPYIVSAFVQGENLADVIRSRSLSATTAIDYAIQIGEGLQAAHLQGIIHRDIKPGNIILASRAGRDPRAKIIDFGLARVSGSTELSERGRVIGTAAYIAPEILQGHVVDERADLWSLGVVLYEMLAGRTPFDAENRERLFYLICHEDPAPVTAVDPSLSDEAARIVAKALEKDRAQRYQTAGELLEDLAELRQHASLAESAPPAQSRASATRTSRPSYKISTAATPPAAVTTKKTRQWMALVAGGALLIVAAILGLGWLLGRNQIVGPPPELKRLTFDSGLALNPAVSPDGKYVAFASDRAGETNLDIWVQVLPGGEPVRLTRDAANEDFPTFSPDGNKIAFRSDRDGGGIYSVPVLGGDPRLLAQKGNRPRYSPDGQRLSFTLPNPGFGSAMVRALFLMPAEGGEPTEFPTGFVPSSNPIWSPDGSQFLYSASDTVSEAVRFQLDGVALGGVGWYIAPVSGGQPVRIEPSAQFVRFLPAFPVPLAWSRSNRILFSYPSGDAVNLWQATLSRDNRRIIGPPEQLTFGTGRITEASLADSGAVVFAITASRPRLWNIPLETRETRDKGDLMAVGANRDFTFGPSLSDTGQLAYLAQTSHKLTLWLRDLPSGKETFLASLGGSINSVSAYVDRSGTQVAYTTLHEKERVIYTMGAGGGTPKMICENCGEVRSWSADRKIMLSQEAIFEGSTWVTERINRIDVASGRKTVLLEKPGFLFAPDLSPDGHWVAFQARAALDDGKEQLFLAPMSDGAPVEPERWLTVTGLDHFDANPLFSRDGNILYFTSDRDGFTCLWAVRLDRATKMPVGDPFPVKHFHVNPQHYSRYPHFSVGPDRIVIALEQVQSDLWTTKLPE